MSAVLLPVQGADATCCPYVDIDVLCFQESDELMEWWNTVKGSCDSWSFVQTGFICLFSYITATHEIMMKSINTTNIKTELCLLSMSRLGGVERDL